MRRILTFLLLCGLTIAVAWWLAGLPGNVAVQVGRYSAQARVPVMVLALILAFVVLYGVVRLIGGTIGLPARLRRGRHASRRRRGDIAVTRALVALAAGEGGDARREAQRARALLGDTAQTLVLVAEAGRQAQREDEASDAYRLLASRSDAAFLGLRGLLRQAIGRQDWEAAADLARQAEAAHPGAAWLRQERWQLAIRSGAWTEALALEAPDAPVAALATAAANVETDATTARRLAKRAFAANPGLPAAALAYATRLRQDGSERRAQSVIREAWMVAPQPDLADFALAPTTDLLARYQVAQKLAANNPANPESHLMLARAALAAGLTGEARRNAEAARQSVNQRRVWLLLADIAEAEGLHSEAARESQRVALRSAATAGADPAWRCGSCGTLHAAWHPVCPTCHSVGQVSWSTPPTPELMPPATALPIASHGNS